MSMYSPVTLHKRKLKKKLSTAVPPERQKPKIVFESPDQILLTRRIFHFEATFVMASQNTTSLSKGFTYRAYTSWAFTKNILLVWWSMRDFIKYCKIILIGKKWNKVMN